MILFALKADYNIFSQFDRVKILHSNDRLLHFRVIELFVRMN